MEQVKAHDDKLETMIMGIQPVLDYVGLEQPKGHGCPKMGRTDRSWIVAGQHGQTSRSSHPAPPMEPSSMH